MFVAETKQRLLARCIEEPGPLATPCVIWTGALETNGYGIAHIRGKLYRLNRLMLMFSLGRPLKEGMNANHKCHNAACCRAEHLYEGTQAQNMREMFARGLWHNGRTLLTEVEVSHIRYFLERGWSSAELALRYNVNTGTIYNIKAHTNWKNIKPFQPLDGDAPPQPPSRPRTGPPLVRRPLVIRKVAA
jgi:HNH endonuclease